MSEFNIRRATTDDAALLSQISGDWFRDQFDGTCTREDMQMLIRDYFNYDQVFEELANPNDYYFLMYKDEVLYGYMRMKVCEKNVVPMLLDLKTIEIKRFYMAQVGQGVGAADKLMDFAINHADSLGMEAMVLSVWEYNVRAQLFYKKRGFIDTRVVNPFPIGNTPQNDVWYFKKL